MSNLSTRGRPKLDRDSSSHAPRLAVRLPDPLKRRLALRAGDEGIRLSDAVRVAVEAWASGPSVAERREIRRLVWLSDLDREALFLASNENVSRLLESRSS